jgi:hypothetical protein
VQIGAGGRELWESRAELRRRRITELLAAVPADDQVALALAAQIGARVLSQMREIADGADR